MKKYRNAGGVAVPAAPVYIENNNNNDDSDHDDNYMSIEGRSKTQLQQYKQIRPSYPVSLTTLVRPVPVRVNNNSSAAVVHRSSQQISHFPQNAAEEFYAATQAAEIPFTETHNAVRESIEWHRKWTGLDTETTDRSTRSGGSSSSSDDGPSGSSASGRESPSAAEKHHHHHDAFAAERQMGAKNPSPCVRDEQRKRERTTPGSSTKEEAQDSRPASSAAAAMVLASEINSPAVASEEEVHHPVLLVRPKALRVVRPQAMRPTTTSSSTAVVHRVPMNIIEDTGDIDRPMSPLSLNSMMDDGASSSSSCCQQEQHHPQTNVMAAAVAVVEDEEDDELLLQICTKNLLSWNAVQEARDGILHELAISGGETNTPDLERHLEVLQASYKPTHHSQQAEGMWLTLTKPTFFGCAGENDNGDPMYSLGRMSFDMFSPGDLICSLQGNFNDVERVVGDRTSMLDQVPKSLKEEVGLDATILRTYNIVTAFTIEPQLAAFPKTPNKDVSRPIRGIMTTYGYMIANPDEPCRHSIWITGGKIEPNDTPEDVDDWKKLFVNNPPKHGMGAQARLLAVKLLMGAVLPEKMDPETGAMEYTFTRPLGGHGLAYIDTLYTDDSLRIVRGHRGTLFVFSRVHQK